MIAPIRNYLYFITTFLIFSCGNKSPKIEHTIFTKLNAHASGIDFNNSIVENDSVNLIVNEYTYMGAGVGIIDINNDGLQDIFFSANQTSSKLYMNEGSNHFKDITTSAGVTTGVWCTGVSVVDINNDGYQDLYVCVAGNTQAENRSNLLFINNKNLTFTESAAEYGLADTAYSTQAVFTDFDKDGDLDMYLLNHALHGVNPNNIVKRDSSGHSILNDHLYLNEGPDKTKKHPVYKDISMQAGIKEDGYGLGVAVSDFNNDGWPDIYVSNDYISNDLLWINNKNGTFSNQIAGAINHQSYSSMGVDAADINNDLLPDIATLDMQPEFNKRKKEMFSFITYERYEMERQTGYEPEFMRNMLQLNRGNLKINDTVLPRFSEIGQLAGMSETDWSWSILMADFDNDGWKDMHITNGLGRDLINADFVFFRAQTPVNASMPAVDRIQKLQKELASLGTISLQNYFYHNKHDYTFTNQNDSAGLDEQSISNGAAYVDLDNDGDLDLIVNNINQPAAVYINNTISKNNANSSNHFLSIVLKGDSLNKNAIGTKVYVKSQSATQFFESNPVRGYASTVDNRILVGLGKDSVADIKIRWPNDSESHLTMVKANQFITISIDSSDTHKQTESDDLRQLFTDVTGTGGLEFKHQETFFNDFDFQRLLPQKYSQLGPFISTGDVNNDQLMDFFIGGAFKQSGKIFIQQPGNKFISKDLVAGNKFEEDMGSIFLDANGDGNLDLFVVSGSNEFDEGSKYYHPRLYLNDGKGNFSMNENAIPASVNTSGQATVSIDYDNDGDLDILIGGRVSPQFPKTPRSYLLQNNQGIFKDVTSSVFPDLQRLGMITAAVAVDFDNDKSNDVVIAGEWMPIRFFKNANGRFIEVTNKTGLKDMNGMWRSLASADVDNDGDADFVAGNFGMNCKYKVTAEKPLVLFARDIDHNGSMDPVIGYYIKDDEKKYELYPSISLTQFAEQVPSIKQKYLYAKDFAKAKMTDIFINPEEDPFLQLYCNELHTCWFENIGKGKFIKHVLPNEAQFAPVNTIVCEDIDNDGKIDLLLGGNEYQTDVVTGRYDASYGCMLRNDGKGNFSNVEPLKAGFVLKGDVKDLKPIKLSTGKKILVSAANDDFAHFYLYSK